jgi:hypothetical protein
LICSTFPPGFAEKHFQKPIITLKAGALLPPFPLEMAAQNLKRTQVGKSGQTKSLVTMEPKKRKFLKRGKQKWGVDFGLDEVGVRRRPHFSTEAEADAEIKKFKSNEKFLGDYLARLPAPERRMVSAVLLEMKAGGLSLTRVWSEYQTHEKNLKTHMNLTPMGFADVVAEFKRRKLAAGKTERYVNSTAAEDVGLADPMALVLANAARQVAEFVGLPEAQIPLAEATLYIATVNKSNSACISIAAAIEDVKTKRTVPVPKHLRDSHYQGAEKLGHGTGYKFAHAHPNHFVAQDYLGVDKTFYNPTEQGLEIKIKERLDGWRKQFTEAADKNVAA